MKDIKYVCSLGTLCHTARMMQRIHVKNVSYPFDWTFTDENILIDILEDDFTKFMDKTYYTDVKHLFDDNKRSCAHTYYHEDFFFHKNPRNEDDYNYYQRCIDRFRTMIKSPENKLFILTYTPQSTQHPKDVYQMFVDGVDKEDIIKNIKEKGNKLNNILMKHTNNYRLLMVMNFGGNTEQSFVMEYDMNICFLTLNTISYSNGITFGNNNDNLFFSGIMCEHFLR